MKNNKNLRDLVLLVNELLSKTVLKYHFGLIFNLQSKRRRDIFSKFTYSKVLIWLFLKDCYSSWISCWLLFFLLSNFKDFLSQINNFFHSFLLFLHFGRIHILKVEQIIIFVCEFPKQLTYYDFVFLTLED